MASMRRSVRAGLPENVARLVWIRAGGICSRPGCGKVLHEDPQLLRPQRFGELAHNVAARPDGPRGDATRSVALSTEPSNLILLCPTCHTLVDKNGGEGYPESLLRNWKRAHERNVRIAASFTGGRQAVPILVSGPIAGHVKGIDPAAALTALRDEGLYPATELQRIELPSWVAEQGTEAWWQAHSKSLQHQIERIVALQGADNFPFAIYPLAEMPPLMLLGHMLGDKRKFLPFQYWRSSGSWSFTEPDAAPAAFEFGVPGPGCKGQDVALILSLTSKIDRERVYDAVGRRDVPIVELSTSVPGTDLVRNRKTIEAFQLTTRRCIDAIEAAVGDRANEIHVFPAMPAPLAVAFGASVMPKVSNPMQIYDARGAGGPFKVALKLPL